MRKVILNLAVTLDGLIAGPNGEYDWCFTDADYGMTDFLNSIDATLMGGKSYRIVTEYGPPYPEFTNYVFTHTEKETPFKNVRFVSGNIPNFVKSLREEAGKNIWLFGGAEIIHPLLEENLIDEMILSVHPIILGAGIPLFKNVTERKFFQLADTISYPSGLVQLIYKK
jgi:dihydrofolate reductase